MKEQYYQICLLVDETGPLNNRLDQIRRIVQQPNFEYKENEGADIALGVFLTMSYWLDKELFDESYLYQKEEQNLIGIRKDHFEMVDIGAALLDKGFPLKYEPAEYMALGPNQLGPYVKTFVDQCQKRYNLFYKKTSHRKVSTLPQNFSNTRG